MVYHFLGYVVYRVLLVYFSFQVIGGGAASQGNGSGVFFYLSLKLVDGLGCLAGTDQ